MVNTNVRYVIHKEVRTLRELKLHENTASRPIDSRRKMFSGPLDELRTY